MKDKLWWFGRYEGWLRWLCKGVQMGDGECIKKSAKLFDLMLPDECVVIPMPGHLGYATSMANVCGELFNLNHNRKWGECLWCDSHEPNYTQKKNGTPAPIRMGVTAFYDEIVTNKRKFIIDNVIASGVTASAALEAIPEAIVCAIAKA